MIRSGRTAAHDVGGVFSLKLLLCEKRINTTLRCGWGLSLSAPQPRRRYRVRMIYLRSSGRTLLDQPELEPQGTVGFEPYESFAAETRTTFDSQRQTLHPKYCGDKHDRYGRFTASFGKCVYATILHTTQALFRSSTAVWCMFFFLLQVYADLGKICNLALLVGDHTLLPSY